MKFAVTYLALTGLSYAQAPPYKPLQQMPIGEFILEQAIAGLSGWGGPGMLQSKPKEPPKPPIKNMIGGLPELFKKKPGSSDWRDDTLKGPRKKPGAVWPKNKPASSACLKRDGLCGVRGGKLPSVSGGVANTLKGIGGGLAVAVGLGQVLNAIPGASDKVDEFKDSVTRFQRELFGPGNTVYPLNPTKYGYCHAVKRDPHPNKEYQQELLQINCPPGERAEETEAPAKTEAELDLGRAVCGTCGTYWESGDDKAWDSESGVCRDDKTVLIWPLSDPEATRPSGPCSRGDGSCGGGQTPEQLDMGWTVCTACSFEWNADDGRCTDRDGKLVWPRKS